MLLLVSAVSLALTDPFGNELSFNVTATPTEDVVIYDRDVKIKGGRELGNLFQVISSQGFKSFLVAGGYDVSP